MKSPEARKLTASIRIAGGAFSKPMRTPASPGPPVCAAERLISSFAFPSMISLTLDERGKIRLVRDVEEDGCDPDQKADAEQLPDRQCVEEVRDRDRREQTGPRKVAGDQDRSAWQTVDPDAGRQAHEQEWEKFDRGQRSDLESGRVQHVDRGERQRELAELRPELTDGLGRPEL